MVYGIVKWGGGVFFVLTVGGDFVCFNYNSVYFRKKHKALSLVSSIRNQEEPFSILRNQIHLGGYSHLWLGSLLGRKNL